jgi:hypothetical protein
MFITYFDESGDDGFPQYSSQLFILSCIYMHHNNWKTNYDKIVEFRKQLKVDYNFPMKMEFHAKQFLQDKNPYHGMYTYKERKEILFLIYKLIAILEVRIINVVIDKANITTSTYDVLNTALTYSIQRIENDMVRSASGAKFIIITDEGRVEKMRTVSRKIQKVNFIPSKYGTTPYRKEIENLLEDPLPKKSDQSYFIQLADSISYIINLYALQNLCTMKGNWPGRILNVLDYGDDIKLLEIIKCVLNLDANKNNNFGVVYYPKAKK